MNISKILATALFCVVAVTVSHAHGMQERAGETRTFKEKLSAFQNKVKQRFDSLRGFEKPKAQSTAQDAPVNHFHFDQRRTSAARQPSGFHNRAMEPTAPTNRNRNSNRSDSPVAQATYVQQDMRDMARRSIANQQQGGDSGNYDPRLDYRNDYRPLIAAPPFPVQVPVNEPLSSTSYSMPNQGRLTNGMHTVQAPEPMANGTAQTHHMMQQHNVHTGFAENSLRSGRQPTATQLNYSNSNAFPQTEQRSGHFQSGFSHVRTLTDQQQVTASERALQLQDQVQSLMAERNALIAENRRLSGIIAENRKMLGKAETSIGASVKQLEAVNRNNAVLKQQVERLIAENNSQKAESKRMLDSIQQRLDELLIREISSK